MSSIYFTGYKPFELNIFKDDQPEVKVIKAYIKELIEMKSKRGLNGLLFQDSLVLNYGPLKLRLI